ncbi:PMS1 protein homolog 1-like isoform X1 [Schistocerca nitens]|uniref:PMS1 protein homolog 1-like isoform X1 n=2 Tax=Schistocerca nitens TaxID=7011 RepID=UPI002118DC4E|nr:PMS1 protein homolog 1-like isoform X1 [Schistocerca nitens]
MSVALLPSSTIRLVTTTQIITTVSSVVKELIENSLDAGATNIEVRLERNGLEKIEIKDNGCGIKPSDVANVCLSSYTSKIQNYSDLGRLSTYGFRGEALSSLCQVSSITITTKTASDNIAMTYMISQDGSILNSRPSHFGNVSGTHIVVTDLFKNLPVRKQYLSNSRNAAEDIRRTEQIVKSIAVIHPEVRITFCHNKCSLWQKPVVATLQESYMQIFGYSISSNLEQLALRKEQVNFELLVPLKNCTDIAAFCQASSNSIMTYFNKRPVKYAKIEKATTKIIKQYFGPKFPQRKYPICVVSVTLPADLLDVNLEPNKTKVFCKEENTILSSIEEMLIEYYGLQNEEEDTENCKQPVSKINRKLKPQSTVEEDRPIKRSKLIAECPSTLESSQNLSISTTALPTQSKNLQIGNENIVDHGVHSKQSENPQNANGNIVGHNGDRTVVESLARVCQESAMAEFFNSAENKETEHCDVLQGIKDSTFHDGDNELKTVESRYNFLHSSLDLPKNSTVTSGEVLTTQLERETGQINSVGPEQRGDMQISKSKDSVEHETVTDMTEHTKIHNDTSLRIESSLFNMLDDIEDVFFGFDTPEQDASQRERERAKQALEAAKSVETTKMGQSANLEDLNKEQWSKGSIKTKNGCTVEGAKLLLPKVNKSKKEFFDLSMHSVSSQMGCKEQSAFTKFSRHMRPKLLEENPGVAFTKVASLLVEHWKQLTDEEKSKYEEIAREEEERKHNVPIRKSTEKICSPSVVEMLNTTPKRKPPLDDLHSVDGCVPCSMTEINQKMEEIALKHKSSGKGSGEIFVIGQIRPHGVWLYMKNREIGIIRHWALQETVEFHKMMKETTVPLAPVMNNIPLRPSLLGPELWNIFTSLEHSFDTASGEIVVSSPFISKNGFRIVISEGPDDDSASISHIASTVRFYDVTELKEILQILKVKGSNCALEHCRPLKILNYFKSEAVTICRKAADTMNYSDLTTNLTYWEKYLKEQSSSCLHRKLIFVPFHTINS